MRGLLNFISEFGLLDFRATGTNFTWSNNCWYFKFEMAWIKNKDVNELVKNVWLNAGVVGWSGFRVSKKVQSVKKQLIRWNQNNGVNYKRIQNF
ncbi:hypothetical protein AMTRI_Chr01g109830 [Amborella trichopoda]